MTGDLREYYARRAAEYERIYQRPQRQADLDRLKVRVRPLLRGRDVLEAACGTGYWTAFVAPEAASICGVDCNREVLAIARRKDYGACPVTFVQADVYDLALLARTFTGGLGGFWWSHVPLARLAGFLATFHARMASGARVAWFDNVYAPDRGPASSTPICRTDVDGNTYQQRQLADGSTYEVLKNFPSEADLRRVLAPFAADLAIVTLEYYWLAQYAAR
jgi:SAM-dependent methyltransferase